MNVKFAATGHTLVMGGAPTFEGEAYLPAKGGHNVYELIEVTSVNEITVGKYLRFERKYQ